MLARPAGDGTGSDKPQRFLRREGRTYPLGTPEDFIGPSNAAHPHARFREKEGPAPQKGGTAPLVVVPTHAGNAGPSSYRCVC